MNPASRIAQGTSLVMIAENIQVYDVETGAYVDLTTPDSCTFRVVDTTDSAAIPEEHTGNQQGSTNTFNAIHTFNAAGAFVWQCEVVEGTSVGVSLPQRVKVVVSIADV